MKKLKIKCLSLMLILLLMLTSINVIAHEIENKSDNEIVTIQEDLQFSKPTMTSKGDFVSLNVAEANTFLRISGQPILPMFYKTYKLPFGSSGITVEYSLSEAKEQVISGIIEPCSEPVTLLNTKISANTAEFSYEEGSNAQAGSKLYPDTWFEYKMGCGLDILDRVIFLTIYFYPVRYNPSEGTLHYIENINIEIKYNVKESFISQNSDYDLVIISPKVFSRTLRPLVNHKNSFGVNTTTKTVEEIYDSYPGRDKPEQIKYFIKDAIETHNIKYVLLVGGRVGFTKNWYVPVRYSNLEDRSGWNETYVSDLYFADIYKVDNETHEIVFEDWDSNGNGIFAEWTWIWNPEWEWWSNDIDKFDVLDLYPDVYVGRLSCNDIFELRTVVRKIINYEKTAYEKPWFNKMITVGGDTSPFGDGYNEGEEENELAASFMEPLGFEIIRLWASTGTLKRSADFIRAVRKGSGFLYLSGHGSPIVWSTHPPEDDAWIDALYNHQAARLLNLDKLPVCVVGGCHNSQFDSGIINMMEGIKKLGLRYFTWIDDENCFAKMAWAPSCWSWNLVKRRFGGTIATIGNTGLGWGSIGSASTERLDGWITTRFFKSYADLQDSNDCTLGMVHSQTITNYVNNFDPNHRLNSLDRKTVEQWVLLGDPSLKIGGYPN